MAIKEGDHVRIATRTPTDEDVKSGLYYAYFGGLTGRVLKVYSKTEVSVEIDQESLKREVRKRHEDVRDQMKTKWLDGLSEEGRSRLTEREKDFMLRYVVLVGLDDLEKTGQKAASLGAQAAPSKPASQEQPSESAGATITAEPPARRTLADIEAAEEAELLRRAQQPSGS